MDERDQDEERDPDLVALEGLESELAALEGELAQLEGDEKGTS